MRWTKSVSLVAFVLVAVLIASGVTATVWARSGGGGAAPPISQPLAQIAQTGTIVIVKDAVPDDPQVFNFSGSGGLGPFSLDDDPNTPLPNTRTFPNLKPDLYTVTELFPIPGWFLMNGSVCKFPDGSATTFGSQATINLTAGATVTCTFTNYKAGNVIVDKVTVPAGDPTLFQFTAAWPPGSFSLQDTSPPHDSGPLPPIGSLQNGYMLTEIPVSGWTTSIACKDPDGGTTVGPTSANPTLAPTAVVIDLDAGETITCIFTNTKTVASAPDLAIAKEAVVSPDGQTITYTIKVTNIGTMPAMNIRVDDVLIPLPSGSQFVSASGPGWSCVAPGSGPVNCTYAGILAPGGPPLTITIIVAVGSLGGDFDNCAMVSYPSTAAIPPDSNLLNNTSCVKTSVTRPDVKLGTIVIIKDAQPNDPMDFEFGGSWLAGSFYLDDDGVGGSPLPNTQTFSNLPPGPYTVKENVPLGWGLSIACKDPDGGTTVAGNSANIDLDAGETVTCIFTNKKDVPPPPATTTYIYSVKIVCGTVTPPRPKPSIPTLRDPAPVVPGLYRTAVNIHNFWEKDTAFLQKVAIALPQDQPRGPVTKRFETKLGPNEALEVDCHNIVATLEGTTPARAEFLKGFLVIESPVELEVTAVYTAEELQENGISIDVEQINPHIVKKETPRGLDLAVSKGQEGKFPIGGVGVYVIKVTANGVATPPIKVTDTLPFGFTFIPNSATPPWTCTVTTPANPPTVQEIVECSYPAALAANATVALMFKVNVNPLAAIPPGPNCAEVKHPEDTNPANDKSCVEVILQASGATPTPTSTPTAQGAGRPGG